MSSVSDYKVTCTTGKSRQKRDQRSEVPPFLLYKDPAKPSFEEGLESVVNLLKGRKNIVVLLGAGISVSCGIPDFRSKGSGLYTTLNAAELGLSCPEELFEASFFEENPRPFYKFARNLYFPLGKNERAQPSDSHKLLALLDQRKMLRRCYSQNIDGLEEVAGVSPKKIICVHGSLQWATCCKCKRKVSSKELENDIMNGNVAHCQAPAKSNKLNKVVQGPALPIRQPSNRVSSRKRPRIATSSSESSSSSIPSINESSIQACGGVLKPDITFFGEALSSKVKRALEADRNKVDALIVIGTSLSVAPISKVIGYLSPNIPRVLINCTIAHPKHSREGESKVIEDENEKDFRDQYVFDAYLLGFCDEITRVLGKLLFPTPMAKGSSGSSRDTRTEGALLANLDGDYEKISAKDWKSTTNVPFERVFLFPGAQTTSKDAKRKNVIDEPSYREVVYCDGCSERIFGTIRKCAICFDYDLCRKCYPLLSKSHCEGKHHFIAEAAGVE